MKPTCLSLFSGLGGLDLGARIAGLDVRLATDADATALKSLASGQGTRTLSGDIDSLLEEGKLGDAWTDSDDPVVVIGGPPCTAFSHAGFWIESKRKGKDPAAKLLRSYLATLERFRPAGFVLENVPGLAFKTHKRFLDKLLTGARRLGYSVSHRILCASQLGVPQARRRLFVVGVSGGDPVDLESWPTFPERSSGWALKGCRRGRVEPDEVPNGKYGHLLPLVPPGQNYYHFTAERGAAEPLFKYRGRYWTFLLKLDPESPSPTLPAQRVTFNGPFHWKGRHLRLKELCRLQLIPDTYPLAERLSSARKHIGNAVPPVLGALVVRRLLEHLGVASGRQPRAIGVARRVNAAYQDLIDSYPRKKPDHGRKVV